MQQIWSESVGGYKGSYELHHWFTPQSLGGTSAGWNLVAVTPWLNNAMKNGGLLYNAFKAAMIGGAFGGSGYCADRWCFGCDYELLMREVKSRWRKALRGSLLVALAAIVFFKTTTLLWAPLLLLALFFYAVDIFSIDKRKSAISADIFEKPITYGKVGEYVVDSTPSFGLFIELQKEPVFIAIKRDRFVEERKARAEYLFQHQSELNDNLSGFLNENPDYRSKRLTYIGLHSNSLEQGELFWSPDGYTILRGLNFLTPD